MQLLVSYRTVTDEALVVAVEVSASGQADFGAVASYRTADRERLEAVDSFGVTEVQRATSVILLVFPATDPGGRVEWSVTIDGSRTTSCCPFPR